MDLGTIIGVITAAIILVGSIVVAEGSLPGFIDLPAMAIVCGGVFCGVLIAFPIRDVLNLPNLFRKIFFHTQRNMTTVVDNLVSLAEVARHDGLLSLESKLHEIDDPFLVSGVRMAIDGLNPQTVESVMRTEMKSVHMRHQTGRKMVFQMGKAAPMFGLMATLMGLVMMLARMDPQTIGRHMSLALLGTFYGTVVANLLFLPFAEKLGNGHLREMEIMELTITGIIAIQNGENPYVIRQRLSMFLPPKQRKMDEEPLSVNIEIEE